MGQKVKSADDVDNSENHLPDHAPCSTAAERRDQVRPTTKTQEPPYQDGRCQARRNHHPICVAPLQADRMSGSCCAASDDAEEISDNLKDAKSTGRPRKAG